MEEAIPETQKRKKKILTIHLICFLLILSVSFNIFFIITNTAKNDYRFLDTTGNAIIDSNTKENQGILHYQGLNPILNQEIENYNLTEDTGVFIQDIRTGAWLGINEQKGFSPASLLKVPIMMAMLKKVENGEAKLSDRIKILPEDADDLYGEVYKKVGSEETVSQLLEQMITFSDNTAKNAIKRQLSILEIDTIFVHVGIPDPYMSYSNQEVSSKGYTRLFKALYYSTYLSPELSERAIGLTTDTQQEQLLSQGVPPEVQVAHKFGVIDGEFLSDCGIVYHPRNPYFICIMIKNKDMEKSKELINKISKDTYDFVNSK
jgi:beta-lactamase class A